MKTSFQHKFKVGDQITWGTRLALYTITEICEHGAHVSNGVNKYFISFGANSSRKQGKHGPIILWSEKDTVPR